MARKQKRRRTVYEIFRCVCLVQPHGRISVGFIEAAAAKLPVVCSDIPVFKSIIPEECSCFFRLGNIDSLCDALVCADKRADVLSEKVYAYYLHYLVRGKIGRKLYGFV